VASGLIGVGWLDLRLTEGREDSLGAEAKFFGLLLSEPFAAPGKLKLRPRKDFVWIIDN
jgi:hypothetical protein